MRPLPALAATNSLSSARSTTRPRRCGRLSDAFEAPLTVDGERVTLKMSMGTALADSGHARPHELLRDAETAVRRAMTGGARSEMYDPALRERILGRISLDKQLRERNRGAGADRRTTVT